MRLGKTIAVAAALSAAPDVSGVSGVADSSGDIVFRARVVGDPAFGLNFAGGKADLSFIAIVKGSSPENKAAAYKLFYEMSLPENQAKAAEVISYTGPSPNLDALLPKDKLWQFPTSKQNKDVQYFENAEWWADNGEAVNKKWEAFKLSL